LVSPFQFHFPLVFFFYQPLPLTTHYHCPTIKPPLPTKPLTLLCHLHHQPWPNRSISPFLHHLPWGSRLRSLCSWGIYSTAVDKDCQRWWQKLAVVGKTLVAIKGFAFTATPMGKGYLCFSLLLFALLLWFYWFRVEFVWIDLNCVILVQQNTFIIWIVVSMMRLRRNASEKHVLAFLHYSKLSLVEIIT